MHVEILLAPSTAPRRMPLKQGLPADRHTAAANPVEDSVLFFSATNRYRRYAL
jgi:hypothetical protein